MGFQSEDSRNENRRKCIHVFTGSRQRLGFLAAILATALTISLPAFASQDYPTAMDPVIAGVQLHYVPYRGAGGCDPADGCFKLNNAIRAHNGYTGGWLFIRGYEMNTPTAAIMMDDAFTFYPVGYSHTSLFHNYLPDSVKEAFDIRIEIVIHPTYAPAGAPGTEQVRLYTTTSEVVIDESPEPSPFGSPGVIGNRFSWIIEPGERPDWIDSQVRLRIEIVPDPSILDPAWAGQSYVWELPFALSQQANTMANISPLFVPTAIIGRPPGDLSWSSLAVTSGQGATLGVSEKSSSSRTTQDSWGLGPFTDTGPQVTTSRSEEQGTFQTVSQQVTRSLRTANPYRPGEGDVMVGLLAPTFQLYRAPEDLDFRLIGEGGQAAFAMKALVSPGMNSVVDRLKPDEIQALKDLNPLLADPHAVLSPPRYYRVDGYASLQGAAGSGRVQTQYITSQQVESVVSQSTTTNASSGFSLDIGGILSAALSVPIPGFEVYYRSDEDTTATVEYTHSTHFNNASGNVLEYSIEDSDPAKELCVTIYYDTYFRTFAFRDCATPEVKKFFNILVKESMVMAKAMKSWKVQKMEGFESPTFMAAGWLGEHAPWEGKAELIRVDGPPVTCKVEIIPESRNIVIVEIESGVYHCSLAGLLYELEISKKGEVRFEVIGKDKDEEEGKK